MQKSVTKNDERKKLRDKTDLLLVMIGFKGVVWNEDTLIVVEFDNPAVDHWIGRPG